MQVHYHLTRDPRSDPCEAGAGYDSDHTCRQACAFKIPRSSCLNGLLETRFHLVWQGKTGFKPRLRYQRQPRKALAGPRSKSISRKDMNDTTTDCAAHGFEKRRTREGHIQPLNRVTRPEGDSPDVSLLHAGRIATARPREPSGGPWASAGGPRNFLNREIKYCRKEGRSGFRSSTIDT